ncbi:MAG: PAS domain S-box protein, partial [Methanoregula sp.]|nr:PAS domain S-box protein [Methanoregula sp.]
GVVSESDMRSHLGLGIVGKMHNLLTAMDRQSPRFPPDTPVTVALQRMVFERWDYVVVTRDDMPLGILTERDIPRLMRDQADVAALVLKQVMSSKLTTIIADSTLFEAVKLMTESGLRHLVVIDDAGRYLGVISQQGLLERIGLELIGDSLHELEALRNERKIAEEELREREEIYRTLVNQAADAIVLIDGDTLGFAEFNAVAHEGLGYTREEFAALTLVDLQAEHTREQVQKRVRQHLEKGDHNLLEIAHLRKDGSVRMTRVSSRSVKIRGKGYLLAIWNDITERKLAEEKLSKMMRQQKIILDIAPVGISLIVDRKQIWVNPKTEDLFQYSKEELEGQTTRKLYPSEEAYEKVGRDAYPVLAQGHTYETEQQLIRRDRTPIWVRYNGMAIEPADLMKGTIWLLEDITERKRAEEALRQSEEKFRTLFESMVPGVFYQRSDGALIDANPAALSMFGLSREQFLDRDSYDPRWKVVSEAGELLLPEHYPSMIALRSGKLVKDQIVGVYNPERDDMVWLSTNAEPQFRRGEATPYQVFVIMYDITERKKAEQTIQHALAEKEVLLREIHHRVKNNLAGILSLIELQTSSLSDPVQIAPFKDLETRIRSMALVHESLSKTKDPARIYFVSYTENLTRYLLPAYGTAGEVKCKIEMGYITLPIETATPCGLVMNEIITNSLKHAFPKTFNCGEIRGEPCTISITLNRDGSDYLLGVSDNGIGMPEGIDVTISHTLGLFLIRFIVEHQLRGSLEISNEGGTAYTIRFPEPKVKERNTNEKM